MKKLNAFFLGILLSTFLATMDTPEQSYGVTPMEEKQEIIEKLETILENPNIQKNTSKNTQSAILNIQKSLDSEYWIENIPTMKKGDKVFNLDQKTVKQLNEIIKNEKELQNIKEIISEISEKIALIDKQLAENAIINELETISDEKTFKKIEKAQKEFEKGTSGLNNSDFKKAINHFEKAWQTIQNALKEPHAKKMKIVDEGVGDISGDELDDIYLKIKNPGTFKKPIKVDVKIRDSCVNGINHEDAGMKMAFMSSGQFIVNERLTDEGFDVTNKWFKKNDENKQINRFTEIFTFFSLPPSGDDMIQINQINQGSFDYNGIGISEIGGQTGWEGSFEIKGNPGDYELVLFFKVTDVGVQDDCDVVSAISMPFTISS